ncbi:MAG: FkbM family methyltransferase [Oscillospiraceae bacterium]|jgi:FkbM family methyltransferase|nr:FkbM family methyltransferase [Oscillospiraceae bacterium]
MNEFNRQKLGLLLTVNDMLAAFDDGVALSEENWEDVRAALSALGVPGENIMIELTERARTGDKSVILQLQTYFTRFFDAQASAAANSAIISDSYKSGKYGCDREFSAYINFLKSNSASDISAGVYEKLRGVQIKQPEYYKLITEDSRGWYFENNWLDGVGGANNSLITNRVNTLKSNLSKLTWLYDNLADSLSRRSLNALIKFWLTWDYADWRNIALYYCDVVDTNTFPFYDDEIFVDCGSYIGDTVMQFVTAVNSGYKRVYTYDISRKSIELIRQNLASLPNVDIRHKGTGEINAEMVEVGVDQAFHGNKLSADGYGNVVDTVKVVRLDDDIDGPITFLKIDCEGMDKETLRGAKAHIQKYRPKLHVDSYHKLADIVDIPGLIREFDSSYVLFLRLAMTPDTPPRFPTPLFMAI